VFRRVLLFLASAGVVCLAAETVTKTTKKSPAKGPHASTTRAKSSRTAAVHSKTGHAAPTQASKTKTATPTAKSKSTASKTKGKRSAPRARGQQAPTTDRYREIQQTLASRGYFHGEPTGEWGPDSVDALKRFQADQNLAPDGKVGSLSLIALGLGPKRLTAQAAPAAAPVPQAAPSAPPATPP